MTTYDSWKTRSDLDEQLPEYEERRSECPACGGLDGDHDRRCPEREIFDPVGDRLQEVRDGF